MIEGGTLKSLGWNVRGLNVGFSSPSAEDPEAGDRHRKLGSAGEPSSGILRCVFLDSNNNNFSQRQAPVKVIGITSFENTYQHRSYQRFYCDSNSCERIF
jgi:hypothetical protein